MYIIKAATFILPLPLPLFRKFVHNFWILVERESDQVVAQLHGLATSPRSNRPLPIGYLPSHRLRAHHFVLSENFATQFNFPHSTFALPSHKTHLVYDLEDALEKWFDAINAVNIINKLDLAYPIGGFNLLKPTVNSNSIYRTFAEILNVEPHSFTDFIQVGFGQSVFHLVEKELKEVKSK